MARRPSGQGIHQPSSSSEGGIDIAYTYRKDHTKISRSLKRTDPKSWQAHYLLKKRLSGRICYLRKTLKKLKAKQKRELARLKAEKRFLVLELQAKVRRRSP